jgi:hypothetical protein
MRTVTGARLLQWTRLIRTTPATKARTRVASGGRYLALLEGFWPLGFIAAGLIAHAVLPIGGWRRVFLIEAAPAVFVFAVRFLVPESPRWLAVRGRLAAGEEVTQSRIFPQAGFKLGDFLLQLIDSSAYRLASTLLRFCRE